MSNNDNKNKQQQDSPDKKNIDPKKKYMPDGTEEPSREANREAKNDPDNPDNAPKFDDNPDETKKKIPNL
ncbi:hypothetical protein Q4E93_07930 [Flavitalea sp. BT771]|uniref:hypothetical protein n=1 Tax=Flavitalea sp. BT771 TaxID=3063329 RepID=UPI0026E2866E|nr:hypothetical protein [Flavitalea sp. BT771]MDO6430510.1 hypothetical protein [Flavitalea sp. BT771]MDV6219350.1 hypothetical protein [Flavitalea sp. BT771]